MKNTVALFCFIEDFFLHFKNTNDKKSTRKTELTFSELISIYSLAVRF